MACLISNAPGTLQAGIYSPKHSDLPNRGGCATRRKVYASLDTEDRAGIYVEDRMRWAEALAIERLYGPDGPRRIAERMGALAAEGDMAGVERFREISRRYEQLIAGLQDSVTIRS